MQILVVDDDFGSRAGMAATLADLYPGARVREAPSIGGAVASLQADPATDLVLLDLNLADSRGIASLIALKRWCEDNDCNPRIVVVSAAADYEDELIPQAIENCATGFITKGTSLEVFRSAIDLTLAGAIYIPERYLLSKGRRAAQDAPDGMAFTPREKEVAGLLIQGLSYKQIARRLSVGGHTLSDNTVRVHVQRMAWKLRVGDSGQSAGLSAKAAVITALAEHRLRLPFAS